MVYAVHKFYPNFCNACGCDDTVMQNDIILTEITKIIADKSEDFVNAITVSKISLPKTINSRTLAQAFVDNWDNKTFQTELAKVILVYNKVPLTSVISTNGLINKKNSTENYEKHDKASVASIFNGGVGSKAVEGDNNTKAEKNAVDSVAKAIGSLSNSANTPEELKKLKEKTVQQILSGIEVENSKKGFGLGKTLLVVGLIGTAIYFFVKYKSKKD